MRTRGMDSAVYLLSFYREMEQRMMDGIDVLVSEDEVVRLAIASVEAGCDEVGLADTTGYANPAQIRRVFRKVRAAIVTAGIPGEALYGYVPLAGVPKDFVPATQRGSDE